MLLMSNELAVMIWYQQLSGKLKVYRVVCVLIYEFCRPTNGSCENT